MTDDEKLLIKIATIGFMLGIAKLLAGDEAITWRKVLGRAILGTGSSLIAGLVMIPHPNASQIVVVGVAALLGILGHSFIEWVVINYLDRKTGGGHK